MKPYTIAIAGTTHRTVLCAEALQKDARFTIPWILTPTPKPVGRKKVITPSPLHIFGTDNDIPVVTVESKITPEVLQEIESFGEIDFLLVVDFGYIIPRSLLVLPSIAPLNIHPSKLPDWRGSSPGQFALLYGQTQSAITLMHMNSLLDQGPIISQLTFAIEPSWNAKDYYHHAFSLLAPQLADHILKYARTREESKQPFEPTTKVARRIQKNDSFIPWENIKSALGGENPVSLSELSPLLRDAQTAHPHFASLVVAATKAFSPWPRVWTLITTPQGKKRMQIHDANLNGNKLILNTVQIEGQSPSHFNQIKNSILD